MTDMEIPPAAIEAVWAAREAHTGESDPTGLRCRCGRRAPSGVDQLRHETRAILAAALAVITRENGTSESPVADAEIPQDSGVEG
jgi:hypothetical protein